MAQEAIFLPVMALALLTVTMLTVIPFVRAVAVRQGKAVVDDFKMGESLSVPQAVSLPNRNYMNLLELPVLFYTVAVIYYATGRVDELAVGLAWTFVGLRFAHSLIHVTANTVLLRMSIFAIATFTLVTMWIVLAQRLFG